jgi:hypothetical protein
MNIANSEQPLKRYNFSAERIDQTIYRAEIAVIAKSEGEAYAKAQAEADENNVDWIEEDIEEGDADITLETTEKLDDEEVQAKSHRAMISGQSKRHVNEVDGSIGQARGDDTQGSRLPQLFSLAVGYFRR